MIDILPAIDLRTELGPDADDAHTFVTERMQEALAKLADERRLP